MKSIWLSVAPALVLGSLSVVACTSSGDVDPPADDDNGTTGGTSSTGGTSATGGTTGTGGSTGGTTASGGTTGTGGSGGTGGATTTACENVSVAPEDGILMNDYSTPCEEGAPEACHGTWPYLVGTWAPYPAATGAEDDTTNETCTLFLTQAMLTETLGESRTVTGTVGTYSGFGNWLGSCTDASAFDGISFTISGDAGPDGMMSMRLTHQGNAATGSTSPSASFAVTEDPTTITLMWEDFTGGSPEAAVDPTELTNLEWYFPWCATEASSAAYEVNVVIDDVMFITAE